MNHRYSTGHSIQKHEQITLIELNNCIKKFQELNLKTHPTMSALVVGQYRNPSVPVPRWWFLVPGSFSTGNDISFRYSIKLQKRLAVKQYIKKKKLCFHLHYNTNINENTDKPFVKLYRVRPTVRVRNKSIHWTTILSTRNRLA